MREAAANGATYVQTPEMTGALVRDKDARQRRVQPRKTRIVDRSPASRLVRRTRHLSACRLDRDPARRRQARQPGAAVSARDGELVAVYDKIHMFDVDLDNGESWRESAAYEPGGEAVVAELPIGGSASPSATICVSRSFSAPRRWPAPNVLTVPAAFTRQTGEAHWHVLLRARAIENGALMIAAAQGGLHEDGRETYGHSLIVDPWGRIVAEAGA